MGNINEILDRIVTDVSKIEAYLWGAMKEAAENRDKPGIEKSKRAIDRWTKLAQDVKELMVDLEKLSTPSEETHLIITIKEEPTGLKILEFDGKTYHLKYWNELLIIIATHILELKNELPIIKNFVHKREEDFTMSSKQLKPINGYYIEVGDSTDQLIRKCKDLLEASHIGKFDLFKITKEGQKIKIH